MCPSLIQIGSKTAEKNSAQTNKQTDRQTNRQTDTTKIMVTWPWTKNVDIFPVCRQTSNVRRHSACWLQNWRHASVCRRYWTFDRWVATALQPVSLDCTCSAAPPSTESVILSRTGLQQFIFGFHRWRLARTNSRGQGRCRGQIFEDEDEDKDKSFRPRTLFRGRGHSRPEESCVKQMKPVSVQHHQKYSPHHYMDETRSK